jgi:hypothetical protein
VALAAGDGADDQPDDEEHRCDTLTASDGMFTGGCAGSADTVIRACQRLRLADWFQPGGSHASEGHPRADGHEQSGQGSSPGPITPGAAPTAAVSPGPPALPGDGGSLTWNAGRRKPAFGSPASSGARLRPGPALSRRTLPDGGWWPRSAGLPQDDRGALPSRQQARGPQEREYRAWCAFICESSLRVPCGKPLTREGLIGPGACPERPGKRTMYSIAPDPGSRTRDIRGCAAGSGFLFPELALGRAG